MIPAIYDRRSVRKYQEREVPEEAVEEVLRAGILAPSAKNRQPWKFIVVSGGAKAGMLNAMRRGLERERDGEAGLPGSARHLGGAKATMDIMEQAPVTVFVVNTLGEPLTKALSREERVYEICNTQSIGAAMENMTLAATELGLGSLWICDTFFAQEELEHWLEPEGILFGAMTLGYADEAPAARPRRDCSDIVEWRR